LLPPPALEIEHFHVNESSAVVSPQLLYYRIQYELHRRLLYGGVRSGIILVDRLHPPYIIVAVRNYVNVNDAVILKSSVV
jgi:hypothetical protein